MTSQNDNDLVFMIDGFDVWLQQPPAILIQRYEEMDTDLVVVGAERSCWPNGAEDASASGPRIGKSCVTNRLSRNLARMQRSTSITCSQRIVGDSTRTGGYHGLSVRAHVISKRENRTSGLMMRICALSVHVRDGLTAGR